MMDESIYKTLRDIDYRPIIRMEIGEDPDMHFIKSYVVGEKKNSEDPYRYAVWTAYDWSLHPNVADRRRGTDLAYGTYMMDYDEAMLLARRKCAQDKESYDWLIPGTGILMARNKRYR